MEQVQSLPWRICGRKQATSQYGKAQDALIMNIDDLCVGATDNILLSSTIGRNKNQFLLK
jgi:hypothetical protein